MLFFKKGDGDISCFWQHDDRDLAVLKIIIYLSQHEYRFHILIPAGFPSKIAFNNFDLYSENSVRHESSPGYSCRPCDLSFSFGAIEHEGLWILKTSQGSLFLMNSRAVSAVPRQQCFQAVESRPVVLHLQAICVCLQKVLTPLKLCH